MSAREHGDPEFDFYILLEPEQWAAQEAALDRFQARIDDEREIGQ